MPDLEVGKPQPRLGLPHEVPNRLVLEVLGLPAEPTGADHRLHDQLLAVIEPSGRSTRVAPEELSRLWEELIGRWPTARYRLLDQVLECVMAGTGVAAWVEVYFGAMRAEDSSETTDRLILAATPSLCCGIDMRGMAYHQATVSSIEYTKAMLTLLITRVLRNHILLHAAAVRRDDGIALLVGRSHTGKSTLAVHCLVNGGQLLSDDLVAVHSTTGRLAPFPKNVSIRPRVREWLEPYPWVTRLFDAGPVPCVANASRILSWRADSSLPSSLWILRGFEEAAHFESISRAVAVKAVLFSLMGRSEAIAKAGRGIERLMSSVRLFANLWQGPPLETAELVLRQV